MFILFNTQLIFITHWTADIAFDSLDLKVH